MNRRPREFIRRYKAFSIYQESTAGVKPLYYVTAKMDLGRIMWNPGFQEYCFYPAKYSVWDAKRLEDIQEFMATIQGEEA